MQNTHDVAIGVTKLWGSHTFKVGYQSQDSMKLQNLGTVTRARCRSKAASPSRTTATTRSIRGSDTRMRRSASSRGSSSRTRCIEGDYVYHNKDFYIQDNWKVNSRLTLDLGMRFTHHGPQYDVKQQASNFFPDQWSASAGAAALRAGMRERLGRGLPARRGRSADRRLARRRARRSRSARSCRTPARC